MQHDVEFMKFEETPELKHLGVAQIRINGFIVLRYKVLERKDGTGYFVTPPSYMREFNGENKFSAWFMLDSMSFSEEVQQFIVEHVRNHYENAQKQGSMGLNGGGVCAHTNQPQITPTARLNAGNGSIASPQEDPMPF